VHGIADRGHHRQVISRRIARNGLEHIWSERPPAQAGGFRLRLKAGFGRPRGPTGYTTLK
jgi:hypothetical protein